MDYFDWRWNILHRRLVLHISHDWLLLLHFEVHISFAIIMVRLLSLVSLSFILRVVPCWCWRILLYRIIVNQAEILVVKVMRLLSIVVMVGLLLTNWDIRYLLNENLSIVVVTGWDMIILAMGHSWSKRRTALIFRKATPRTHCRNAHFRCFESDLRI